MCSTGAWTTCSTGCAPPRARCWPLPYALELNDSVIHAVEKHATGEFGRRLDHTLNVYAREAAASGMPRVLTLGLHPHLMACRIATPISRPCWTGSSAIP